DTAPAIEAAAGEPALVQDEAEAPPPAEDTPADLPATARDLDPGNDDESADEPATPVLVATPPAAGGKEPAEAVGGAPQKMFVIAVASQKGGVGKTTISAHLAVQAGATGHGPAVLIDTDPQGSLGEWWRARKDDTPALAHVKLEDLSASL